MAKTFAHLWPAVVDWHNLLLAYRRCRRRKRYKPEAAAFHFAWEANLLELQRELMEETYQPGPYRHFYIYEPKERKISAAPFRDRIVHHAVVNVLEPIYERRFVVDSYACRRGKGTHRAIQRASYYLQRHPYYLKTDIVRFFPNVDHEILLDLLGKTIRDQPLRALVGKIVNSGTGVLTDQATPTYFPGDDLFAVLRPRGLPIGNLTSQFFANVLLDQIDHFVKEELRVPGYVRYADDLLLFGPSKHFLWHCRDAMVQRLAELRLRLHVNKTQVRPASRPVTFLGFVLSQRGKRLTQDAILRFNRRVRRQRWLRKQQRIKPAQITASLRCWLAHVRYANSTGIRRKLWRRLRF